jgi:hypothetical protein
VTYVQRTGGKIAQRRSRREALRVVNVLELQQKVHLRDADLLAAIPEGEALARGGERHRLGGVGAKGREKSVPLRRKLMLETEEAGQIPLVGKGGAVAGDARLRRCGLSLTCQEICCLFGNVTEPIEQLIDEVCLDADGPRKRWFLMNHRTIAAFSRHDDRFGHRRDRRYALRLTGKTSFTEEIVRLQHCDDGFLALLRNDGDLHLAALGDRKS